MHVELQLKTALQELYIFVNHTNFNNTKIHMKYNYVTYKPAFIFSCSLKKH